MAFSLYNVTWYGWKTKMIIFHVFIGHYLLWSICSKNVLPIIIVFICPLIMLELYILHTSLLLDVCTVNIPICVLSTHILFISTLICQYFIMSNKFLPSLRLKICYVFFKNLSAPGFYIMNHFKLIFACGVRKDLRFVLKNMVF